MLGIHGAWLIDVCFVCTEEVIFELFCILSVALMIL
jgi:hypothetical protein